LKRSLDESLEQSLDTAYTERIHGLHRASAKLRRSL
jgi:hypothetical protein